MPSAIVTGGASGIGAACVAKLASNGYAVVAADIAQPSVASVGIPGVTTVVHDVTNEHGWDALLDGFGRLDVLINNAGIGIPSMIVETSFESWRRQMEVNLDGCFLGVRAALRHMLPQGHGVIVNISSVAALRGTPMNAAYCAAKAGVHLLTKTAAREAALVAPDVRVVSVHPGLFDTPGAMSVLNGSFPAGEGISSVIGHIPAGRMGETEEVASLVAFLISDEARYLTGGAFTIDGGMSA